MQEVDVLADYEGLTQYLQIQCSGELVGIINRFWQRHFYFIYFFQNVLEKSNMGVACFHIHRWSLHSFLICCSELFLGNCLFFLYNQYSSKHFRFAIRFCSFPQALSSCREMPNAIDKCSFISPGCFGFSLALPSSVHAQTFLPACLFCSCSWIDLFSSFFAGSISGLVRWRLCHVF